MNLIASNVGEAFVNTNDILKAPRNMRIEDCMCDCSNRLTRDEMETLFRSFNLMGNHVLQNSYLKGCARFSRTQTMRNGTTRRIFTYELRLPGHNVNVCKRFFLGIHGITAARLRNKVNYRQLE